MLSSLCNICQSSVNCCTSQYISYKANDWLVEYRSQNVREGSWAQKHLGTQERWNVGDRAQIIWKMWGYPRPLPMETSHYSTSRFNNHHLRRSTMSTTLTPWGQRLDPGQCWSGWSSLRGRQTNSFWRASLKGRFIWQFLDGSILRDDTCRGRLRPTVTQTLA